MSSDDLRPKPVPRPAATRGELPPDQLPGEGRPPLKTGKVVMSDFTRRNLEAVGWKEGDPVPGDLGQRLQELQREVMEEKAGSKLEDSDLAAGWQPPQSSFVAIEDLPPEKQEEIRQYLADYKQQVQQEEQFAAQQAEVDAQIPENIQGPQRELMRNQIMQGNAAAAARQMQQPPEQSVVIDDRPKQQTASPPSDAKIPEGKNYAGSIGKPSVADKIAEAGRRQREHEQKQQDRPQQQPSASTAPQSPSPETGVDAVSHTHCQRCAWPLSQPFDVEPTLEDKQGFMASVLGLSRFEKKYELLGGKLVVFFRSLSSEESALLNQQLGFMVRSGAIVGDGEYWAHLMEYRLVMSVSRIEAGGHATYQVPPLLEWAKDRPKIEPEEGVTVQPTPIPYLKEHFYKEGATQEPVRRFLGQAHRQFQRLVELLETMTSEPDFWQGIELPA